MKVLIIGAHGQVGQRLVKLISKQHKVYGMIRDESQSSIIEQAGGKPVIGDLEEDISNIVNEKDIIIFTAGSGSKTGPEKTIDVDQEGAIKSIDIAEEYGIKHYIMVSAQGARDPEAPSKIQHYYQAKAMADNHLIHSNLDYTIFRPGRLTNDIGTGLVEIANHIENRGNTSRDNLAIAISLSVNKSNLYGKVLEILDGDVSIADALLEIK